MTDENHEEDWAIYLIEVNENQIGSILVDLGLNQIAPVEAKPFLVTMTTFMNDPAEDGLASEGENETLNRIEDGMIEAFRSKHEIIYAGRLKFAGKIRSFFYSEDPTEIEAVVSEVKAHYPNYRFEYDVKTENDWEAYFELLLPSPVEMQSIQNARVIDKLEQHGDSLKKERAVEHWIYFQTETDRENFIEAIKDQNFEILDKAEIASKDAPFSLQLSRIDKVDYQSVDEYVLYLWHKAQQYDGDYDGWETSVVKD